MQKNVSTLASTNQRVLLNTPRQPLKIGGTLNSLNAFDTFLRREAEQPRLSVLKNFKSINRVMRSSFLKNPVGLPDDELERYNRVKELAKKMTGVMKHIAATSRIQMAPQVATN